MKITQIECHVLLDPSYKLGATSSAQDDLIVEIHTDEGVSGFGESDLNPWIGRECIEAPGTHTMGQSLTDLLIGQDPLDVEGIWERLYVGSAMNGRRGAVIHAMGAIDIALHDLRGKALNKPCHAMLGQAAEKVTPYASLQPDTSSFTAYRDSLVEWALIAKDFGFRAAKLEATLSGPYAHMGLDEPNYRMTEVIEAVRSAVGDDMTLMVDVQYAFSDADTCLATLKDWTDFNLFFVETPLASDDLDGYAKLTESQSIPIAAGEWLSTRHEFEHLINIAHLDVLQPDIGRVGGLTEARRVAMLAKESGRPVVPHLWKTGLSIAAAVHFAAVTPHCPYIEFMPAKLCESALRRRLLTSDIEMVDGQIEVPTAPGLGVEIDRDALAEFAEAARKVRQ